jgi:hypothetical protein
VKNTFSIESQEILIQIEWDLFHCDLEVKIFHMNSSYFFLVFDEISSTVHGFEAIQPMFINFDSSRNHESHRTMIQSSYLTHLHTQAFRKISQVVIFKLSSCDSSPPLEPVTGESSNDHRMSYTHPNFIPQVSMGSRR